MSFPATGTRPDSEERWYVLAVVVDDDGSLLGWVAGAGAGDATGAGVLTPADLYATLGATQRTR